MCIYENQELGVSLQRPEQWAPAPSSDVPDEPDVSDEPDDPDEPEAPIEWLALVGDDGLSRLTLLTQFDEPDAPLSDRLDRAVAQLTPEEAGAVIVRSGPVTLADGSEAERAADPEVHSDTAALYLSDIVGVRERLDGDATEVSGVEAVDERTVRITIDAPKEYFLAKLAYPSSAVVDRLTVESLGEDWWMSDDVNGSGPFRLLRWDEEVVILQRFDDYHTPVSLEYLISPLAALRGAGALDMYQTDAWDGLFVGARSLDSVREDPALSGQLREYEQLTSYFVALDGTRPPFDDPKVRRAFAMALDRERFIEEVYDATWNSRTGCCRRHPRLLGIASRDPVRPGGGAATARRVPVCGQFPGDSLLDSGRGRRAAPERAVHVDLVAGGVGRGRSGGPTRSGRLLLPVGGGGRASVHVRVGG